MSQPPDDGPVGTPHAGAPTGPSASGPRAGDAPASGPAASEPLTADLVMAAARAVAAEDEDRAGVASFVALLGGPPAPDAAGASEIDLARDVDLAWSVLRAADERVTVQDALAAVGWWRLRPPSTAERGAPGAGSGPSSLAAWSPGDDPFAAHGGRAGFSAARERDAGRVSEAVVAGRVLRVVNHHHTPASHADELRRDLTWYADRFAPVTEDELHRALETGRWASTRPGVVPAFYDGFASAARVAAPICEDLGLVGWFYPPTQFLDTPVDQQRAFGARHELGVLDEDADSDDALAMTWDELADLATRHVVAGHSATHATSASVRTAAEVEAETLAPLRRLAEVIGRPVASWAWLGGTPFDSDAAGDRAVAEAGVRLWTSNTSVQRLRL